MGGLPSSNANFFKILKNPNLAQGWIVGLATALLLVTLLTPFLRERFHFSELTTGGAALILFSVALGLLWHETIKTIYRSRKVLS